VEKGQIAGLDEMALIKNQQQISDKLVIKAESLTGKKLQR